MEEPINNARGDTKIPHSFIALYRQEKYLLYINFFACHTQQLPNPTTYTQKIICMVDDEK